MILDLGHFLIHPVYMSGILIVLTTANSIKADINNSQMANVQYA